MKKARKIISCAAALATALSLYSTPIFAVGTGSWRPVIHEDSSTSSWNFKSLKVGDFEQTGTTGTLTVNETNQKVFKITEDQYVTYSFSVKNPAGPISTVVNWEADKDGPTLTKDAPKITIDGTEIDSTKVSFNAVGDTNTGKVTVDIPQDLVTKDCEITIGLKVKPSNDAQKTKLTLSGEIDLNDDSPKVETSYSSSRETLSFTITLAEDPTVMVMSLGASSKSPVKFIPNPDSFTIDGRSYTPSEEGGKLTFSPDSSGFKKLKKGSVIKFSATPDAISSASSGNLSGSDSITLTLNTNGKADKVYTASLSGSLKPDNNGSTNNSTSNSGTSNNEPVQSDYFSTTNATNQNSIIVPENSPLSLIFEKSNTDQILVQFSPKANTQLTSIQCRLNDNSTISGEKSLDNVWSFRVKGDDLKKLMEASRRGLYFYFYKETENSNTPTAQSEEISPILETNPTASSGTSQPEEIKMSVIFGSNEKPKFDSTLKVTLSPEPASTNVNGGTTQKPSQNPDSNQPAANPAAQTNNEQHTEISKLVSNRFKSSQPEPVLSGYLPDSSSEPDLASYEETDPVLEEEEVISEPDETEISQEPQLENEVPVDSENPEVSEPEAPQAEVQSGPEEFPEFEFYVDTGRDPSVAGMDDELDPALDEDLDLEASSVKYNANHTQATISKETLNVTLDQVITGSMNEDNTAYTVSVKFNNYKPEKLEIGLKAVPDIFDLNKLKVLVEGTELPASDYAKESLPISGGAEYKVTLNSTGLSKIGPNSKVDLVLQVSEDFSKLDTTVSVDNGKYIADSNYTYNNETSSSSPFSAQHQYDSAKQTWTVNLTLNRKPQKLVMTFDQQQGTALLAPNSITLNGAAVSPSVTTEGSKYVVTFSTADVAKMDAGSKIQLVFPINGAVEQTEKIVMNVDDGTSDRNYSATFRVVRSSTSTNSTNSTTNSGSNSTSTSTSTSSQRTDGTPTATNTGLIITLCALVLAAGGFIAFAVLSRKNSEKDGK